MKIVIINGPNLNLLGTREIDIYGRMSFDEYFIHLIKKYWEVDFEYFQSNFEGEIIEKLHEVGFSVDGIVMNPGAYAHTSIAIADAIASIDVPVIEVHITNVHARESFRHHSFSAAKCIGTISGLGLKGYSLAIRQIVEGVSLT